MIKTKTELTPVMSSNIEMTSLQICKLPDAPKHNMLKRTIRNLIKEKELDLVNDFSVSKIAHTNFICKKVEYLDKQNKKQEEYIFNKHSAIFVASKVSNMFLKHLITKYDELETQNNKVLQVQLEQYKKQFSITDNRVVIFDESNIPEGYIKFSEILRRTTSGLPKSRIQEILLAMQVPYVEYNSTYESSDGFIHKGKLAKAFLQKDIRVAFNNFKHDLVKITNLYSHSRILNSKIKYVNLNTF